MATTAKNVRTDLTDSPPLLPDANVTTTVSIAEGDDPNDFTDEAILRSYAARTIPYFEGTEDDEDDGEDSDTETGASNLLGLGMRNMFGRQHQTSQDEIFGARGISGTGRAQELLIVPSSDDHHLRIEITWAEKGTYNNLEAHFIRLTVDNIGPNKDPLKSLALAVRVRPAPHAKRSVQSAPDILVNNAAASSTAIPETTGEDSSLGIQAPANRGTRSLDGATAAGPATATGDTELAAGDGSLHIAYFAPKTYSGAPTAVDRSSDLELNAHAGGEGAGAKGGVSAKKSWGADWTVEERYRLQIYLDRPEVYSFNPLPAAKDDSKTIMRVYYDSNKMYKHSTPTLHLGLVVVSYGAPFILTARAGVTPNRANPLKARVTRHSPIKFAKDGPELIPPGYERIGIDFVSKEMAEKMKRLVPLPKESDETVHLGSDTVVLE